MRVLIAEDNRGLAEAMAYCLRKSGHAVDVASDGEAALGALRRDGTHMLVLDLGLPKVEGAEVLRSVREHMPRLPVLVSSARDDAEVRLAGQGLRGDAYLAKPFSITDFERAIVQLAWRFGLAEREAAALTLEPGERRLLTLLSEAQDGWVNVEAILPALAERGAAGRAGEVERCVEGLREKLAAHTPVRLVKVRGLGYGLVPAD